GVLCTLVRSTGLDAALAHTDMLRDLMEQSPSFKAVVRGPQHVFERVNGAYFKLFGDRPVLGLPAREALPELLDENL
ncbi:hypothetical protein ABTE17_22615, partial [Acinetobacter baumannii]